MQRCLQGLLHWQLHVTAATDKLHKQVRSLAATAGSQQRHKGVQERVHKLLEYGCHEQSAGPHRHSSCANLVRLIAALTCQSVLAAAALARMSAAVLRRSASSASACQLCTCRHSSSCEPGPQHLSLSAQFSQCLASSGQG